MERALKQITRALANLRRPKAWKWAFLQHHGKLPSAEDWDLYLDIYRKHVSLRDLLLAEMKPYGKKASDEAA